jgi:hypothetical protein
LIPVRVIHTLAHRVTKLIEWADANKMKRALEILAKSSAREERMQTAAPEPALPQQPVAAAPGKEF